ncbi:hypothetical protein LDENG_00194040 [Lucifuga dentata]|nr:hypothetical protein LDENG_00194040 [Lucifuga dentata]
MASAPLQNWNTDLFDCCSDTKTCCYAFWCCPCFACSTSADFGTNRCLPLCDILSPAIIAACGIPLCVPPAALSLRVAIRYKYGIKGSLCKDIATSCFCEWCAWCQMAREIKHQKKSKGQPVRVVVNQHHIHQQNPMPMSQTYGYA